MAVPSSSLRSRHTDFAESDGIRVRPAEDTTHEDIRGRAAETPGDSASSQFECNVCLDAAAEPVVTRCGHLYCWTCLHRWLQEHNNCPVCKAGVTVETVVPLYGRGGSNRDPRSTAPPRPRAERVEAPPNPAHFQHPFGAFFGGGGPFPPNAVGFTAFAGFPGMGVHMQMPLSKNVNDVSSRVVLIGVCILLFLVFLA